MRYGFVLPGGTATEQLQQAVLAERSGWDGVFVWEAAYGVDAWTLLAAMAQRTSRLRLGTMLTPLPWRRPWKVASQAATTTWTSRIARTWPPWPLRCSARASPSGSWRPGRDPSRCGGRCAATGCCRCAWTAASSAGSRQPTSGRCAAGSDNGGVRPGFDMVIEGETPAGDPEAACAIVAPWEAAGCTWWLDARWEMPHESPERMAQVRERLRAGPPRR